MEFLRGGTKEGANGSGKAQKALPLIEIPIFLIQFLLSETEEAVAKVEEVGGRHLFYSPLFTRFLRQQPRPMAPDYSFGGPEQQRKGSSFGTRVLF